MDRDEFEKMMAKSRESQASVPLSVGSGGNTGVGVGVGSGGGGGGNVSASSGILNVRINSEHQPEEARLNIGFDVVEAQRVALQPGDVLMITVKNDDIDQESVDALRRQLQIVFPNNKVFIFAMGTCDDVNVTVVSEKEATQAGTPETEDEHMKMLAKQAR